MQAVSKGHGRWVGDMGGGWGTWVVGEECVCWMRDAVWRGWMFLDAVVEHLFSGPCSIDAKGRQKQQWGFYKNSLRV